jgi:hypothetical protein
VNTERSVKVIKKEHSKCSNPDVEVESDDPNSWSIEVQVSEFSGMSDR